MKRLRLRASGKLSYVAIAALLLLSACITTPYKDVPVSQLADEQLIEELSACAEGVGESINKAQFLMATKPDPAYVLSSSTTNFFGTYTANVSAYAMPVGYGYQGYGSAYGTVSGFSNTQYYYTDANAFARSMHYLGVAIAQSRAASYRQRGLEVLTEIESRIEQRTAEVEKVIEEFFRKNPNLKSRSRLIGAILPWAVSEGANTPRAALERAKKTALMMERGVGISGAWYGVFSQTTTLQNQETVTFNQFVRVELVQRGTSVTGNGELGTGEQLEISGEVIENTFEGIVANITSAINSRFAGIVAEEQMVIEYVGVGVGQRLEGTAVLLR